MTNNTTSVAQQITFGWHLDGQRATAPADTLGVVVVGPLGLQNILETQLGLMAIHPSAAERTIQYRQCLQVLDSPARFYHRSFALDPLGTAACLLAWRDDWALHSRGDEHWDDLLRSDAPARLRDLAAVEQRARSSVSPNIGQRLGATLAALKVRTPDIAAVQVLDPIDSLPLRWKAVLTALPVVQSTDLTGAALGAGEGVRMSFLGALQRRLAHVVAEHHPEALHWRDDGTVIVVQAETHALAAHWVATRIAVPGTVLVSGNDGARLDAHLAALGHARQGLKEASVFRPALQVLPMVTELLWAPLNYYALVQFLTHPIGPVPRFARQRLAEKVAEAPGIGGTKWLQALAEIAEHYGPERAPTIATQITYWIEHPRFDTEVGAPLAVVTERVAQLFDYFRRRLGETDAAQRQAFISGFDQCRACMDALNLLGAQDTTTIRPSQLQKLVAQASGHGTPNPLWPAEVGAAQLATQPGAVIEPAERVIWWQLAMPVLPGALPWSAAEVRALSEAGVCLPDPSEQFAQTARTWLRPVMAAREQLILVLPPAGDEVHPLWQMITSVVDAPKVTALEDLFSAACEGMAVLTPVALPTPKRWWQLPADVTVALRPKESFSSLEQLLFNPYQWLLRYPAALRSSRLVSLGSDFLLFGNLAHGLIEHYFQRDDALTMADAAFDTWFGNAFKVLIEQEGALLLTLGRGADLANFRSHLHRAMQLLRLHVRQARVCKVVPEQALEGHFEGGSLAGFADLVLHMAEGEPAIVDMKWSGAKKYPEKLKHNRHLQLAIYAELFNQQTGRWPSVAYYLLDRARLLAPDNRSFPEAETIAPDDGENTAQLWQRFLSSWRWRSAQIRAGQFEVVIKGIEPTDDSTPPEDAMTAEMLNAAYNDYRALTGWKD